MESPEPQPQVEEGGEDGQEASPSNEGAEEEAFQEDLSEEYQSGKERKEVAESSQYKSDITSKDLDRQHIQDILRVYAKTSKITAETLRTDKDRCPHQLWNLQKGGQQTGVEASCDNLQQDTTLCTKVTFLPFLGLLLGSRFVWHLVRMLQFCVKNAYVPFVAPPPFESSDHCFSESCPSNSLGSFVVPHVIAKGPWAALGSVHVLDVLNHTSRMGNKGDLKSLAIRTAQFGSEVKTFS